MVRKVKKLAGIAAAGMILMTGCGFNGVSQTCSTNMMGVKLSLTYGAKSENDKVDRAKMQIVIPMSMLNLAGVDTTDKEAVKDYVMTTFGGDVENEASMTVNVGDEEVTVTADANREIFENSSDTAPTFKEVKEELEQQSAGMFTCY